MNNSTPKEIDPIITSKILSYERRVEGAGMLSVLFAAASGVTFLGAAIVPMNTIYSTVLQLACVSSLGVAGAMRVAETVYGIKSSRMCWRNNLTYDRDGKEVRPYVSPLNIYKLPFEIS